MSSRSSGHATVVAVTNEAKVEVTKRLTATRNAQERIDKAVYRDATVLKATFRDFHDARPNVQCAFTQELACAY
jgi:hypothetical protein